MHVSNRAVDFAGMYVLVFVYEVGTRGAVPCSGHGMAVPCTKTTLKSVSPFEHAIPKS